jgi:hypothetical protein
MSRFIPAQDPAETKKAEKEIAESVANVQSFRSDRRLLRIVSGETLSGYNSVTLSLCSINLGHHAQVCGRGDPQVSP